jgi:hypothetical protein
MSRYESRSEVHPTLPLAKDEYQNYILSRITSYPNIKIRDLRKRKSKPFEKQYSICRDARMALSANEVPRKDENIKRHL